jgi:vacuolar-type H+-ATPase subunit I/STV1
MPETGSVSTSAKAHEEPRVVVEDGLHEIQSLSALAQWIEDARGLCERVSEIASSDPDLQDVVKRHGVAINSGLWNESASAGLSTLLRIIEHRTTEITAFVLPELQKLRQARDIAAQR